MQIPMNIMPRTIMKGSMFSGLLAGDGCGGGGGEVWFGILKV